MRILGRRVPWVPLVGLGLAACGIQVVDLGNVPPVGARDVGPDASRDAATDAEVDPAASSDGSAPDGGQAPGLSLEVLGRRGVVRLQSCAETCVDVTVRIEGGTPPYQVRWDDGDTRSARPLCVDASRPRSVVVVDGSDGLNPPATLGLPPVEELPNGCDAAGWTVCTMASPKKDDCSNDSVLSVDLGRNWGLADAVSGWALLSLQSGPGLYDAWLGQAPCGTDVNLYSMSVLPLGAASDQSKLSFGPTPTADTFRHLVVNSTPYFGPLGQLGPVMQDPAPEDVVALQLCEHGLSSSGN